MARSHNYNPTKVNIVRVLVLLAILIVVFIILLDRKLDEKEMEEYVQWELARQFENSAIFITPPSYDKDTRSNQSK